MWKPLQTVADIQADAEILRRRSYGVIEMTGDGLVGVHLRPWPKVPSVVEAWWQARGFHRRAEGNRCWLYYNQPLRCPDYLALVYLVSSRETTPATVRGALGVLDEIARLKRSHAIVAEANNLRITDRLLRRWGWEAHFPSSPRRHFIKRFE